MQKLHHDREIVLAFYCHFIRTTFMKSLHRNVFSSLCVCLSVFKQPSQDSYTYRIVCFPFLPLPVFPWIYQNIRFIYIRGIIATSFIKYHIIWHKGSNLWYALRATIDIRSPFESDNDQPERIPRKEYHVSDEWKRFATQYRNEFHEVRRVHLISGVCSKFETRSSTTLLDVEAIPKIFEKEPVFLRHKRLFFPSEISGIRIPCLAPSRPLRISNSHPSVLPGDPRCCCALSLFGIFYLLSYVKFMTLRRWQPPSLSSLPLEFLRGMQHANARDTSRTDSQYA